MMLPWDGGVVSHFYALCTSFSILGYHGSNLPRGLAIPTGLSGQAYFGRSYKLDGAFGAALSLGMPIAFNIESSLPSCERNTSHSS